MGSIKNFLPQVGAMANINSSGEWGAISSIHIVALLALSQLSNITDNVSKAISFCKALNREKTSLRHFAMVTKFLDLNKPWSRKYGTKKRNK